MVKGALFGQNMWIFLLIPLSSVLSKVPTLISYNPHTTKHPSFAQVISSLYIYPANDSWHTHLQSAVSFVTNLVYGNSDLANYEGL